MSAIVRLRLSSSSRSWTTRMSSASASASALTAAASRWACCADLGGVGGGLLDHLGGLLLGEAQHLAGLAAEPGVGGVLVLVDLGAQRLDLGLERLEPRLGLGQAGGEAGLLGGQGAQVLVDGGGVVAAATHGRQRRAAGRRAAGSRLRPGAWRGRRLAAAAAAGPAACGGRWAAWTRGGLLRRLLGGFSATFWAVFWGLEPCSAPVAGITWVGSSPELSVVVKDGQALVAHASQSSIRGRGSGRRSDVRRPVSPMQPGDTQRAPVRRAAPGVVGPGVTGVAIEALRRRGRR